MCDEQNIGAQFSVGRSDLRRDYFSHWLNLAVRPFNMTPLGYIGKRIAERPEWLAIPCVKSIYSVANCISSDFADYIPFWRHNGFWLFDHPGIIVQLCVDNSIDMTGLSYLYLESDLVQYDTGRKRWSEFQPESSFETNVSKPIGARLMGFDVVTFSCGNTSEHSPLSCNHVASEILVNEYCLIDNSDDARDHIEAGVFANSEPGPLRVVAVHEVEIGTNNAMH